MKKVLALVLALAMVMMMFVACKKQEEKKSSGVTEPSKSNVAEPAKSYAMGYEKYNLACLYSEVTGDFWSIVFNGCTAALEELKAGSGVDGYCIAPATASDYTQQVDLIDTAVNKGADGIVLCPSNADSIGTYVTDKFKDDKTPIIVIDRSLNTTSPAVVATYASDAYAMAEAQAQMMHEMYGDEEEVTYISMGLTPENKNWADRSFGCIEYCKKNYPNFTSYTGDQPYWVGQVTQDIAIQYVQDTVNSNRDKTLCFLGTCNSYNNYIIAALSELGEAGTKVGVIGWDFSETEKANIESGVMFGSMGQNPYLMGYDSTYMMCDFLSGKKIEKNATVPYQAVTKNNINTEEVQNYLKTMNLA